MSAFSGSDEMAIRPPGYTLTPIVCGVFGSIGLMLATSKVCCAVIGEPAVRRRKNADRRITTDILPPDGGQAYVREMRAKELGRPRQFGGVVSQRRRPERDPILDECDGSVFAAQVFQILQRHLIRAGEVRRFDQLFHPRLLNQT